MAVGTVAVGTVAVALGVPAVAIGLFLMESGRVIDAKREALSREVPRVIADADAVARPVLESPLFAPPGTKDAGPFLNERLDWEDRSEGVLISTACAERLVDALADWPSLKAADVADCDTSWLHELRAWDAWSLEPGFRSRLPAGPRHARAMPDVFELQVAAAAHLVRGMSAGPDDAAEAADDVRHLAHLLFTQQYAFSAMAGLAVLGVEEQAHTRPDAPWGTPALTAHQRWEVRRRILASAYAANSLAPASLLAGTRLDGPPFIACMLWTEAAASRQLTNLPADTGCPLEHARFELEHPWEPPDEANLSMLSRPARLGATILSRLAPTRFKAIADALRAADALPAKDTWDALVPESEVRAHAPR